MTDKQVQLDLDIKKWVESEKAGRDLCGSYSFCEYCEKTLKNPCAEAMKLEAMDKAEEEPAEEVTEEIVMEDGSVKTVVKYRVLTFAEKLAKAKDETKANYEKLVKMCEAQGFFVRMLKRFVIVRFNGYMAAKITLNRNSLKMHMALNPDSYKQYTHMDYSKFKCYAMVPFTVKYDSDKAFKSTEALLPKLVKKAEKEASK